MKFLESMTWKRYASRLNGAYRRFLKDDDHKMVIRDIVGFAKLGLYEPETTYTAEQHAELRGRQQMALHILRHLDLDAVELIERQNEIQQQASYITED